MTTIQQDNLSSIADYMQMTDESVFKMHKVFFLAETTVVLYFLKVYLAPTNLYMENK